MRVLSVKTQSIGRKVQGRKKKKRKLLEHKMWGAKCNGAECEAQSVRVLSMGRKEWGVKREYAIYYIITLYKLALHYYIISCYYIL